MKYVCPSCNFPVFNRRVKNCEKCNALLPDELLYSAKQVEDIDAEFEKNKAKVDGFRTSIGDTGGGGGAGGGFDGGDWGGCDGGGDCD